MSQERTPQQNKEALETVYKMQREINNQFQVPGTTGPVNPPISGNVPPAIQEMLKGNQNPNNFVAGYAQQHGEAPQMPHMQAPAQPQPQGFNLADLQTAQGGMQKGKLQELIENARKFTYNYETIQLPSMGKFYNGVDGPQDGILHIRPMSGNEEDILANTRLTRKGDWLKDIFKSCIKENYNPENFLTSDRHYILIFLRGISFGPDYDAEVTCSVCEEKFPTTIDLDTDLTLNVIPENWSSDNLNDELPVTKYKFSYRFPRISDDTAAASRKTKGYQDFGTGFSNDTVTYRLSLFITDLEGVKDQRSIQTILKELPLNDLNYIKDCINNPPFGVDTEIKVQCPYCLSQFSLDMPMGLNFFFPVAKKQTKQV